MNISVEAICNCLENVKLDGSDVWVPNWRYDYRDLKRYIIDFIEYGTCWEALDFLDLKAVKEWSQHQEDWEQIIENNDVAMFPQALTPLKKMYQIGNDKDFCENITRITYESTINGETYFTKIAHDYRAEYGVFKFRNTIGENLFKELRRHLKITVDDFTNTYGESLLDDPNCCDEMLIELLTAGHLSGALRNYKIEKEYVSPY